jgi:hypothetical protein
MWATGLTVATLRAGAPFAVNGGTGFTVAVAARGRLGSLVCADAIHGWLVCEELTWPDPVLLWHSYYVIGCSYANIVLKYREVQGLRILALWLNGPRVRIIQSYQKPASYSGSSNEFGPITWGLCVFNRCVQRCTQGFKTVPIVYSTQSPNDDGMCTAGTRARLSQLLGEILWFSN